MEHTELAALLGGALERARSVETEWDLRTELVESEGVPVTSMTVRFAGGRLLLGHLLDDLRREGGLDGGVILELFASGRRMIFSGRIGGRNFNLTIQFAE